MNESRVAEPEQMAQAWARERRLMASSDVDLAVEAFLAGWDARESTATPEVRQGDGRPTA